MEVWKQSYSMAVSIRNADKFNWSRTQGYSFSDKRIKEKSDIL